MLSNKVLKRGCLSDEGGKGRKVVGLSQKRGKEEDEALERGERGEGKRAPLARKE